MRVLFVIVTATLMSACYIGGGGTLGGGDASLPDANADASDAQSTTSDALNDAGQDY